MGVGDILRIVVILAGVFLLMITVSSLARRKMTESFCLTWGLVAIVMILAGILLQPYGISELISVTGLVLILIVGFCVVFGAFYITEKVSELTRKNQELSIQITLLNQENRMIMEQLEQLTKDRKAE
ncbi:MAG: DUF2304 domain-containing protein [Lachnospiraceae bacterium]|nr:DUF2304 domain-containing protein [Lachnospiraceae bacterium]